MDHQQTVRLLNVAWGCLAVALLAAFLGYGALNTEPKASAVKCGGRVMSPSDTCRIYREPGHVLRDTKSFDEMRQDIRGQNVAIGWILVAGSAGLVVASAVSFVRYARAAKGVTFTKAQHDATVTTWVGGMWAIGLAAGITGGLQIGGWLGWLVAIGGSVLVGAALTFAAVTISEWRFKVHQRAEAADAPGAAPGG